MAVRLSEVRVTAESRFSLRIKCVEGSRQQRSPRLIHPTRSVSGAGYATRTNSVSGNSTDNAVLWLPSGEIVDFAPEPGTRSHAVWVNNLREVSGWIENSTTDSRSFGTDEQTQSFIWQFGVLRYLGALGRAASYGEFINDLGQVSGHAHTGTTPNGVTGCPPYDSFIWQHGKITAINPGDFGGAEGGTNF